MEPITEAGTHTIDQAAQFGPEVFLAVVVIILFSGFMYLLITQANRREERMAVAALRSEEQNRAVVGNNTAALQEVVHLVAKTCSEIEQHESSTKDSRTEVHDMAERTKLLPGMDSKLDTLVERVK